MENFHSFLFFCVMPKAYIQITSFRRLDWKLELWQVSSFFFQNHKYTVQESMDMKNGYITGCFLFLTEINLKGSQKSEELDLVAMS